MTNDELSRITRLEDIHEIRRLKGSYAQEFDNALNGGRAFPTPPVLDRYVHDGVFECEQFGGRYKGHNELRSFGEKFASKVSFSLQYHMNPVIDVAEDRETASGRWTTWHPLTWEGEAYILTGHYTDLYARVGGVWLFQHVHLDVSYMTPYHQGWAQERVPAELQL